MERLGELGGGFWQMVRTERWKYVRFRLENEEHLYDLQQDPFEQKDLVESNEYAQVLLGMRHKLNAWLEATPEVSRPRYYYGVSTLGKGLIFIGILFVAVGLLFSLKRQIPWLGKLPGDIYIKRDSFQICLPLATCILISILLTLIFYIVS